jgi:hypothetical protein
VTTKILGIGNAGFCLTSYTTGTSEVAIFSCALSHNSRLWLVDTPGFDDTKLSDMKVLETVATHLGLAYANKVPLNGIIYLHRISDVRLQGSARKNLRMFRKLCGPDNLKSVVLATTMWSKVTSEEGEARELELKTRSDFWGELIGKGCTVMRHSNDSESARRIVDYIVDLHHPVVLDIQKEMIDKHMKLDETNAGMEVEADLQEERKHHKEEMIQIEIDKEEALAAKQFEYAKELGELAHEHAMELKKKEKESAELKMNFEELMMRKDREKRQAEKETLEVKRQQQADKDKHERELKKQTAEMEALKRNEALKVEEQKGKNEAALHRRKVEADERDKEHQLKLIKQQSEKDKSQMKHDKEMLDKNAAVAQRKLEAQAERDRLERETRREMEEKKWKIESARVADERAAREELAERDRQERREIEEKKLQIESSRVAEERAAREELAKQAREEREERARERESQEEMARWNSQNRTAFPCTVM